MVQAGKVTFAKKALSVPLMEVQKAQTIPWGATFQECILGIMQR